MIGTTIQTFTLVTNSGVILDSLFLISHSSPLVTKSFFVFHFVNISRIHFFFSIRICVLPPHLGMSEITCICIKANFSNWKKRRWSCCFSLKTFQWPHFSDITELKVTNVALRPFVTYQPSSLLFHHKPQSPSKRTRQVIHAMSFYKLSLLFRMTWFITILFILFLKINCF